MQDQMIIELYWQRDEKAIEETQKRYGAYLFKIAMNVLADRQDSEESVSDTYLKAWNSIPPARPALLRAYLARITRQTAIDVFRRKTRRKREGSLYEESLAELEECVSAGDETQREVDGRLLAKAIETWLLTLSPEERGVFLGRYYFLDSLKEIAAYSGFTEAKVKSLLFRLRASLREKLKEEGFQI